jgi:hypothetical protein
MTFELTYELLPSTFPNSSSLYSIQINSLDQDVLCCFVGDTQGLIHIFEIETGKLKSTLDTKSSATVASLLTLNKPSTKYLNNFFTFFFLHLFHNLFFFLFFSIFSLVPLLSLLSPLILISFISTNYYFLHIEFHLYCQFLPSTTSKTSRLFAATTDGQFTIFSLENNDILCRDFLSSPISALCFATDFGGNVLVLVGEESGRLVAYQNFQKLWMIPSPNYFFSHPPSLTHLAPNIKREEEALLQPQHRSFDDTDFEFTRICDKRVRFLVLHSQIDLYERPVQYILVGRGTQELECYCDDISIGIMETPSLPLSCVSGFVLSRENGREESQIIVSCVDGAIYTADSISSSFELYTQSGDQIITLSVARAAPTGPQLLICGGYFCEIRFYSNGHLVQSVPTPDWVFQISSFGCEKSETKHSDDRMMLSESNERSKVQRDQNDLCKSVLCAILTNGSLFSIRMTSKDMKCV